MKRLIRFMLSFFLAIITTLVIASGGNWFRVFLHLFGRHWWTPWIEKSQTPVQTIADIRLQSRRCRICGFVERRQF